jgi:tetratricopeptide (TPR) repeat protein
MSEAVGYFANLQRGILLRAQQRPKESVDFIGKAIEADPQKAEAYAELALSLNDWGRHETRALQAIDRAIALEPGAARLHGLKGWILVCQRKFREALRVANQAVALDPVCITALNAQANAHTKLGQWKQAQASARRILEQNPNDGPALNLLAQALRLDGRGRESREVVARILSLLPNNAFGQMNAGYAALEVGDHLRANEHFLSSLRLNPHSEHSRAGLLQSMRARVWIYRWQLRINAFIRQPATFRRVLGTYGVILSLFPLGFGLEALHHGFGMIFTATWLASIYLSFTAGLTGDIFLLFDPMGRHALSWKEKRNAGLFAVLFLLLLVRWILTGNWVWVLMLTVYLSVFALSIFAPQLRDHWQRRRASDDLG